MVFSLKEKIASEITLSTNPGQTIKKWREIFEISQTVLAEELSIKSSVISDYEHGRRRSPGINIIQKIINGLIEIDKRNGSKIINKYSDPKTNLEAIIDIKEFYKGISISKFANLINGEILSKSNSASKSIYGYTIIDSLKAILTFSAEEYIRLFGWNSDRALIFTGVEYGRSPMIAIRTHTLKPAVLVYHQPKRIDPLAIKLAEIENIVFLKTDIDIEELMLNLQEM
jgi:putative transcriptional regulator